MTLTGGLGHGAGPLVTGGLGLPETSDGPAPPSGGKRPIYLFDDDDNLIVFEKI